MYQPLLVETPLFSSSDQKAWSHPWHPPFPCTLQPIYQQILAAVLSKYAPSPNTSQPLGRAVSTAPSCSLSALPPSVYSHPRSQGGSLLKCHSVLHLVPPCSKPPQGSITQGESWELWWAQSPTPPVPRHTCVLWPHCRLLSPAHSASVLFLFLEHIWSAPIWGALYVCSHYLHSSPSDILWVTPSPKCSFSHVCFGSNMHPDFECFAVPQSHPTQSTYSFSSLCSSDDEMSALWEKWMWPVLFTAGNLQLELHLINYSLSE